MMYISNDTLYYKFDKLEMTHMKCQIIDLHLNMIQISPTLY